MKRTPSPVRHATRGFTLIELLAVLAILAALVAMALPMAETHGQT